MNLKALEVEHLVFSRRNRTSLEACDSDVRRIVEDFAQGMNESRARNYSDVQLNQLKQNLTCLILDLLACSQTGDSQWIGYSRGKTNFTKGGAYWSEVLERPLISSTYYISAIEYLHENGFVEDRPAQAGHSRFSSRVKPSVRLVEMFNGLGLNWTAINEIDQGQNIVVKDASKKPTSWPRPENFDLNGALDSLSRINANLSDTFINLSVSDDELDSINERIGANIGADSDDTESGGFLDFTDRTLRRVFANSSFSKGGRFYGGWWQRVPSEFRKHIEINGAVTVELDFSTIQPRILYATVNLEPPDDSYVLPSWGHDYRHIVKKAFSQLLNSDQSSRNPNQWHRFAPDVDPDPLPNDWFNISKAVRDRRRRELFIEQSGRDYSELIRDLLEYHEPISNDFFSGVWEATQNLDAQIVEKVLISLLNEEVPETALPIHDSFIVRRGAEELLRSAMVTAFNDVIDSEAKIHRDDTVFDRPPGYVHEGPVISSPELHEQVKEELFKTKKKYYLREQEWTHRYSSID